MAFNDTNIKKLFDILAKEFNGLPTVEFECIRDIAKCKVGEAVFGDKADYAAALMTAHIFALSGRGGAGGQVTQEKVGDLSRSYSVETGGAGSDLSTTAYGRLFIQCRKQCPVSPIFSQC